MNVRVQSKLSFLLSVSDLCWSFWLFRWSLCQKGELCLYSLLDKLLKPELLHHLCFQSSLAFSREDVIFITGALLSVFQERTKKVFYPSLYPAYTMSMGRHRRFPFYPSAKAPKVLKNFSFFVGFYSQWSAKARCAFKQGPLHKLQVRGSSRTSSIHSFYRILAEVPGVARDQM